MEAQNPAPVRWRAAGLAQGQTQKPKPSRRLTGQKASVLAGSGTLSPDAASVPDPRCTCACTWRGNCRRLPHLTPQEEDEAQVRLSEVVRSVERSPTGSARAEHGGELSQVDENSSKQKKQQVILQGKDGVVRESKVSLERRASPRGVPTQPGFAGTTPEGRGKEGAVCGRGCSTGRI